MRTLVFLIFLTLGANGADVLTGKVVGVTDGDTLTLRTQTDTIKVRLTGIDAPETGQPFGAKSKQALSAFVFGKLVMLTGTSKDRYGRTLGTVSIGGQSANLAMVATGFAWHYKRYDKSREMAEAEEQARANRRGLWADPNPIPPWDWRRGKR